MSIASVDNGPNKPSILERMASHKKLIGDFLTYSEIAKCRSVRKNMDFFPQNGRLSFSGSSITAKDMVKIFENHGKKITSIDLSLCKHMHTKCMVKAIVYFKSKGELDQLKDVNLNDCDQAINDEFVRFLHTSGLQILKLKDRCGRITDVGLASICTLELRELDLSGHSDNFTNRSIQYIANLKNTLTKLDLAGRSAVYGITDEGLKYIGELFRLEELDLSKFFHIKSLKPVAQLKNLSKLALNWCPVVESRAFSEFGMLEHLTTLKIGYSRLLDYQMEELVAKFPNLETLDLRGDSFLKDKCLMSISKLKRLKALNLKGALGISHKSIDRQNSLNQKKCQEEVFQKLQQLNPLGTLSSTREKHYDFKTLNHLISSYVSPDLFFERDNSTAY